MDAKIAAILCQTLDVPEEELPPEPSMENLEAWDSLNHLAVLVAVESEFGIKIPIDMMLKLVSAKDIADYLAARGVLTK